MCRSRHITVQSQKVLQWLLRLSAAIEQQVILSEQSWSLPCHMSRMLCLAFWPCYNVTGNFGYHPATCHWILLFIGFYCSQVTAATDEKQQMEDMLVILMFMSRLLCFALIFAQCAPMEQ
jgi:hypothetical protein